MNQDDHIEISKRLKKLPSTATAILENLENLEEKKLSNLNELERNKKRITKIQENLSFIESEINDAKQCLIKQYGLDVDTIRVMSRL